MQYRLNYIWNEKINKYTDCNDTSESFTFRMQLYSYINQQFVIDMVVFVWKHEGGRPYNPTNCIINNKEER